METRSDQLDTLLGMLANPARLIARSGLLNGCGREGQSYLGTFRAINPTQMEMYRRISHD